MLINRKYYPDMRTQMCNIKIKYLILQWTMRIPSSEATWKAYRETIL